MFASKLFKSNLGQYAKESTFPILSVYSSPKNSLISSLSSWRSIFVKNSLNISSYKSTMFTNARCFIRVKNLMKSSLQYESTSCIFFCCLSSICLILFNSRYSCKSSSIWLPPFFFPKQNVFNNYLYYPNIFFYHC